MGLEGGVYLYHKMTPPPNLSHSWVVFEGWSQISPSEKLFRHGFEQSCFAMAMQKLEENVQQHDEIVNQAKLAAEANRGHVAKQVPTMICDTYARRILFANTMWGGYLAHREQNKPLKNLRNKCEIPHFNFTTTPKISAFNTK